MPRLDYPETHYLHHAIGWLELGSVAEARAELNNLSLELQSHPDVLEVRWAICAQALDWPEALEVAKVLLEKAPDRPSAWLHQAYALRRVPGGGLEQAWNALFPAAEKFPKMELIAYNLSCYACQMNHLDTARLWFKRSWSTGDKEHIRQRALEDQDLQLLWPEIKEL